MCTLTISRITKEELDTISVLMQADVKDNPHENLYHNWEFICSLYKKKSLMGFFIDNKIVGFAAWTICDRVISQHFIFVAKALRRQGFGIAFQVLLNHYFRKHGNKFIVIEPVSDGGRSLAKDAKFKPLENIYSSDDTHQYLPLYKGRESKMYDGEGLELLIWKGECNYKDHQICYSLEGSLKSKPISAEMCHFKYAEVRRNGETIMRGSVEYIIPKIGGKLCNSRYAFINKLTL